MMPALGRRTIASPVTLGLLILLITPAACKQQIPPRDTTRMPQQARTLTVLTPHDRTIREAFEAGFWDWCLTNREQRVRIEWVYRGAPQCVDYVRSVPKLRSQGAPLDIPDVMFGGGVADHARLAEAGLAQPVNLDLALKNIPAEINGVSTHDAQNRWFATGLSSFGILCNEQACGRRGITPPNTWADLADPRFQGWLAVADPRASGSHRECLALILQHEGWTAGWGTVLRVLANTRALNDRSREALRQVGSGVSLATFAVNFEGMRLARQSDGVLAYVDPPGATTAALDIISVLATANDEGLAKDFARYVLSEDGQALWSVEREHRAPYGDTLYHYPIDPTMYAKYGDKLSVDRNPFETDFGLRMDSQKAAWQRPLLKLLVAAACEGENHVQLQQVWQAVIAAGLPADALAELTAPLLDEAQAEQVAREFEQAGADGAQQMIADWSARFARKYANARAMLGS